MNPKYLVWHCSATKENVNYTVEQLERDHLKRGFYEIGYHVYVRRDGTTHLCRSFKKAGAHVKGSNYNSLGFCYEGGLDRNGKPKDTRTEQQKQAMLRVNLFFKGVYPNAEFSGHRDFSPDKNGDGVISPNEYIKNCPCFEVKKEYNYL